MKKKLETEFSDMLEMHKQTIIQVALTMFEHEGIYDIVLLRRYRDIKGEGMQKASNIVEALLEDRETFEALYKYSWELVKDLESMDYVV